MNPMAALAAAALVVGCGKHCEEGPGDVSAAERTWIAYAPGQTVVFVDLQGDTAIMTAGVIESRWHNGGGSKGDCRKDFESLHQPLSGLVLYTNELMVVHDRETGNAPGYVCGPYMDMAPVNGVSVNGMTYDNVYISSDAVIYFTKAVGLIKAGEWVKVP